MGSNRLAKWAKALAVLCLLWPAKADDVLDSSHLPLRVHTSANAGLPMDYTGALAFDREGHLWVGTQEGAVRFDGRTWTRLDMPRPSRSNWPLCIYAAADGSLWFGTYGDGLHRYFQGAWTSYTPDQGFPDTRVNAVVEAPGPDGLPRLWAGTHDHGLWGIGPDGRRIEGGSGLGRVLALEVAAGDLWVGTDHGLFQRREGAWARFHAGNSALPDDTVKCLSASPAGLWVGTAGGLARVAGAQWTVVRQGLPSLTIKSLAPLPDGTVWVGTEKGLARWQRGRFTVFGAAAGMPSPVIENLVAQTAGPITLWAATSKGLVQVSPGKWSSFRQTPGGLPENHVFSLLEAVDGRSRSTYWFGTYGGGLAALSEGRWRVYHEVAGHPMTAVRSLAETGSGSLWVGTFRQGLFRLQGGRWERVAVPARLARAEWRQLVELRGRLWAATSEGLACLDGREWKVWTAADGLPHGDITRILETRSPEGRDILWVGTGGGGLGRLEDGRWSHIGPDQGLEALWIMDLFLQKDAQGRPQIWVCTAGGGIWTLDLDGRPGRPEAPAPREGTVYGLQQDARGRLYAFTTQGVLRWAPGRPGREHFTVGDGLPNNDCNLGASMVDRAGRVWVGTPGGAAVLDPEAYVPDQTPKPLLLRAEVPTRGGALRPGAVLSHRENRIRFELALLSFVREGDTRYQVQLEGLDPEPGPWQAEPRVEYPRLPPGRYVFRAWAQDYAGNRSGPVAFAWSVRPAPFFTLWAFGAYAVLLGLLFAGLLTLRTRLLARRNQELEGRVRKATRELEALNQEKNEFIALVAHDLKSPLSLIQQLSGGLLRGEIAGAPEASRPWLEMVARAARDMSALIHRVLNVNALESGDLYPSFQAVDVALLTAQQVQGFFAKAERKQVALDVEGLPEALWARTDGPYVQQIMDNLISNAIKFSPPGGTVWIRGSHVGQMAVLEVQDQGPGLTDDDKLRLFQRFAQLSARPTGDESSSGLGLSIAKRLVEALQGWIHVDSEPGKGATFRVELPSA